MLHLIRIKAGPVELQAELNQSRTAAALLAVLPVKATASTWGDEIRPASAVTVVGRIVGDPRLFKSVKPGAAITVSLSPAAPG